MSKKSLGLVGLGVVIGVFGIMLTVHLSLVWPDEEKLCNVLEYNILMNYDTRDEYDKLSEELLQNIRSSLDAWYLDNCDKIHPEAIGVMNTIREHIETLP